MSTVIRNFALVGGLVLITLLGYWGLSSYLLHDHVVSHLLSPGGLTGGNVVLALLWMATRLVVIFGLPALIALDLGRGLLRLLQPRDEPPQG